jgi:ABC-type transport system substrate-binding protein
MNGIVGKRRLPVATIAVLIFAATLIGFVNLAEAQEEDVLIVGVQNDTVGLNPWDPATNSIWKSFIYRQWVFEALYTTMPDGSNVPMLADPTKGNWMPGIDWDANDPMNFTVYIRPGITFTDGTPLTADDVVFSYQTLTYNAVIGEGVLDVALSHPEPVAPRWNTTTIESKVGVFKIDDLTVKFWLAQPYWGVLEGVIGGAPIMPKHIWEDKLVPITIDGNLEFDFETTFGAEGEIEATIGTGPWKLDFWTPFVGAQLSLYDNYWGKGEVITYAGGEFPLYPKTVDKISITIFGTLDVALLALSRGDVHVVPWNMGPSYYNALKTNPNLGFEILTDSGFFYLAFNMRRQPMALWEDVEGGTKDQINLAFRRAVGHAIDKDFIVDRLMGGFGVKGTVPIGILNPGYVNTSAIPPEFDLDAAVALLNDPLGDGYNPADIDDPVNDDGFLDRDGDGWRDFPKVKGGGPLKFSILTPPKDYDPIRADAGIMISKNLKSIGLNIDSAPTSFDTIVTQAFVTFEFDMYILGWGVGLFPEFYLRTFFGCGGGNNAPGYCNPEYDALMDKMDVEIDTAKRQQIIKDATGLLVEDLPYDVLYYRQNIEGYRKDVWVGWVPSAGEIYQSLAINNLVRPAAPPPPPVELKASISLPQAATTGTTVLAQVLVTQGGLPAADADVTISWDFGPDMTAKTDSSGSVAVPVTLPFISGTITLRVTATKGGLTGGDSASITVIPPAPFAQLTLEAEPAVIGPSDTAVVTAKVTDQNGMPIQGVEVRVDPEVLLGSVDVNSRLTDTNGEARFAYSPPSAAILLNRHIYDLFKASITVPNSITPEVQSAAILIGIDNPLRDWKIVDVIDVSPMKGIKEGELVSITVKLTDHDGDALEGETVVASLAGNTSAFVNTTPLEMTTNAMGEATFIFQGNVSATDETNHTIVRFDHASALTVGDSVGLIAWNGTDTNFGRGVIVEYDVRTVDAASSVEVTVTLWNETGGAPKVPELNETGVPTGNFTGEDVFFELPFADVGSAGHFDAGLYIWFWADVAWGVTNMTTGEVSQTITTSSFATDIVGGLNVAVGGTIFEGGFPFGLGPLPIYTIQSDFLIKRAKMATLASVTFDKSFVSFNDPTATMTLTFEDKDGPVAGMDVQVYVGIPPPPTFRPSQRLAALLGDFVTDANGQISVTFQADRVQTSLGLGFSVLITDPEFVAGFYNPDVDFFEGAPPHDIRIPYVFLPPTLIVTGFTTTPVVKVGDTATFLLKVTDIFGTPIEGATVFSGGSSTITGADGTATLSIVVGSPDINTYTFSVVKDGMTGGVEIGVIGGVGSFSFSNQAVPTTIVQGSPVTLTVDVTNSGPVADIATVELVIDGVVVARKSVEVPAGATVTVSFDWIFTDTAAHEVSLGGLDAQTVQAAAPGLPAGAMDVGVASGLMVLLLAVGIIVGVFVVRFLKPRGGGEAPPETE